MAYLVMTLRALVAGVFLVSFVGKVRSREAFTGFAGSVRRIGRVPRRFATPVAVGVIAVESGIVVLTAVPATGMVGLVSAGVVLTVFAIALATALRRGAAEPCRCFGVREEPIAWRHVVRNIVLAACALGGAALTPGVEGASIQPAAVPLCLLVAAAFVGVVAGLDDLMFLFR
ncbi:MauE/DoxX family redox-associated membrane protein [Actinomadura sp. HBU206391]|uniref:MauE/DoxX family redox-associated membrane protein n=1 Tax=Actinomadura sp. HBU206391 TaxID=2731692 RepID=UPI00164FBB1E|nr:MauE/DoxX family redox-associated membrane protein [Actinomadura sp. HBU206391]MBC6459167.1 methylamine utilization protein MauE [Actinomadura sp. HBU206391]